MSRTAIVNRPLDLAALIAEAQTAQSGAIATFLGVVRDSNQGRAVTGIDYSAYGAMAEREMATIARGAEAREAGVRVVAEHRVGHLSVGEASVAIVVAAPGRKAALDACASFIEALKKRVPIWKREHYADGTREWVHAGTSEPMPAEAASE